MGKLVIIIIAILVTSCVSSQRTPIEQKYFPITLNDSVNERKVVAFALRQRAVVYVRESAIRRIANRVKLPDYFRILDSAFSVADTIRITTLELSDSLNFFANATYVLASEEVDKGNIKILMLPENQFISTIYYYLEKNEHSTVVNYCLPDKRLFYFQIYLNRIGAGSRLRAVKKG